LRIISVVMDTPAISQDRRVTQKALPIGVIARVSVKDRQPVLTAGQLLYNYYT